MKAVTYRGVQIEVQEADITEQAVDAIVNAANNELILGSGVAGAIRRKGGESIQEECLRHGPIKVGEAAITGAGNLPAKYVIHAASMALGGRATAESIRSSVAHTLRLAEEHGVRSIAFPAIGMGIGGFPLHEGAKLMMETLKTHLDGGSALATVRFCLFGQEAYQAFAHALQEVFGEA
ncbi:MAG: macro domain-containing protein [Fimbriimonadales bacterium]|jgi:O-acetyl-ADP-ribose deacetylase (regulator of RNase III)|nr:macro domain-containing protein [Armatimonadota bacterium]MCX7686775.1 macro domain-containing protein [Fimbriimonadales bacterium]CUU05519.1 O-acetyl-ADP-ribose deacetylase (regulator of RNase III), contains Macro domain [Armatimonadetes bacterium GBS]CUU36153.1 O-acetyl-ADP-ribose deacetylase (regulator of RNase III), contains Macro domain [Armatimonadetes bacterium GXS]CUU37958.1 O-acetyl-ADP-ribose deacetylase (regulator of RNase III), contains Macro domain [Armatimonadetes bacterium DC]